MWQVCSNNPHSLEEQTVGNTDRQTLYSVARNTLKQANVCLREGGGHSQHLLQSCSKSASSPTETVKQLACLVSWGVKTTQRHSAVDRCLLTTRTMSNPKFVGTVLVLISLVVYSASKNLILQIVCAVFL
jgi:hypothetical protein